MNCVLSNQGMPSILHEGIRDYMLAKNVDLVMADNLALKNWLRSTQMDLLNKYPEMPLDANGEPMLFFLRDADIERLNPNEINKNGNITNDLKTVINEMDLWKPVFLKSYPEFLTDEETISNNYVNLDRNSGTNGFIHLSPEGTLIGDVPIPNTVEAFKIPKGVQYSRTKSTPTSIGELKTFSDYLSRKMGIKYQIVSIEQAQALNPKYNNEPGFFVGNQAYLVSGVANKLTALHEIFGHPIIEILEQDNPDLLMQLMNSLPDEIKNEIMENYPELIEEGELTYSGLKEGVIRAIELEAMGRLDRQQTTFLRNLIDNIWMMLKRLFRQTTGVDGLGRYTTIADITQMAFNKNVFKLIDANSELVMYQRRNTGGTQTETLAALENVTANYKMINTNGQDSYKYLNDPNLLLERLTEVINTAFSNEVYTGTIEERSEKYADNLWADPNTIFDNTDTSKSTGKIRYNGELKTYQDIVNLKFAEINTHLKAGRYVHALFELYFTTDPVKITDIHNRLKAMEQAEVVNGRIVTNPIKPEDFDFVNEIGLRYIDKDGKEKKELQNIHIQAVLDILQIKLGGPTGDKVLSEFIIGSPKLKIGTTADLLVINDDGAIRIIDYKTGNLNSDEHYATTAMKYMRLNPNTSTNVPVVNKQNIYGMGIMLRAFIIKEQIPNARFSDLAIYNINKQAGDEGLQRSSEDLPWDEFLFGIENWIKNEKPELYEEYKSKGLFDFRNYATEGFEFRNYMNKNSTKSVNSLQEDIVMYTGQIQMMENLNINPSRIAKVRTLRDDLVKVFLETRKLDAITVNTFTKNEPLPSNLLTSFRNRYDFSKVPLMQMIINYESEAVNKALKRYDEMMLEHNALLDNVISDFERIDPSVRSKLKLGSNRFWGIDIYKGDGSAIFDFAYVQINRDGVNQLGWITNNHPDWNKLTKAQKDYMEFINSTMRAGYKTAVQDVDLLDIYGRDIKKSLAIGKDSLEDGFLPYVPPLDDEKSRINSVWKELGEKLKGLNPFMLTDTLNNIGVKSHPGMPIRFLNTSSEIKETKAHSLHVEHMFGSFMKNLYLAEELEPVLASSQGLIGYLESLGKDENYNYIHKNTIEALSTFTKMNITGRSKVGDEIIKIGRLTKEGKEVQSIDVSKILTGVKNFTTYSSMFLNPVLAGANAAMIASLNFKTAGVNSLMISLQKTMGIDTDDIDFTMEDMLWAQKEYVKIQKLMASGDKEGLQNNKLWRMMKTWRIFPDDYWFKGSTNKDYAIQRDKWFTANSAMFLHMLGENYGVITTFAAIVHKMKVKKGTQSKTVYEAYDVTEEKLASGVRVKKLKWNFGVRGVTAQQGSTGAKDPVVTKITDLTSREIDHMKRAIAKIHGDYRKNERTLAEAYALGQYFLQFKKYMLRQARNMFEGRRIDSALGKYENVIDPDTKAPILLKYTNAETGLEEEESYIEWIGRVTEGRYTTAFLSLFTWLGHSNFGLLRKLCEKIGLEVPNADMYKFSNLSTDQKKNLMHVGADVLFILLGFMLKEGLFDDDEQNDKNPFYVRYTRYMEDMTEGANVVDTLRGLKNPFPLTTRLYNLVNFGSEFMGSVISGDRTENGDYRGLNSLLNNLPAANSYRQLQRFSGE